MMRSCVAAHAGGPNTVFFGDDRFYFGHDIVERSLVLGNVERLLERCELFSRDAKFSTQIVMTRRSAQRGGRNRDGDRELNDGKLPVDSSPGDGHEKSDELRGQ